MQTVPRMTNPFTEFLLKTASSQQGRNHVFKVVGPVLWSMVLFALLQKIRQVYPVWCSRLHNHTQFIERLRTNLGVCPNFVRVRGPDFPDPQWLRPDSISHKARDVLYGNVLLLISAVLWQKRVLFVCV